MRRIAWLIAAAAVALGVAGFAFLHVIDGIGDAASASTGPAGTGPAGAGAAGTGAAGARGTQQSTASARSARAAVSTRTRSLTAGGRTRSYLVIAPVTALPKSAPVIIMLSGYGSTVAQEESRDRLLPYVVAGKAKVVYPVAVGESWNAVGCCGYASAHHVNDLAFLKALAARVNPGGQRRVFVIGYSNGARLAYRVACAKPGLFAGYAMVKGVPTSGCALRKPVNLIQLASFDDPEIPYQPGDHGLKGAEPVTTLMARLHAAEKCTARTAAARYGSTVVTTWTSCGNGKRLALALWRVGVHSFPRPPGSKPAATQVIWSFFTRQALAPLPG